MFCLSPWRWVEDAIEEDEVLFRALYLRFFAGRVQVMNIPQPEEVAEVMALAIRERRQDGLELPLPKITKEAPADIRMLARGEMAGFSAVDRDWRSPARHRIAFVASSDRDGEADER
jgi:hypothetical protein